MAAMIPANMAPRLRQIAAEVPVEIMLIGLLMGEPKIHAIKSLRNICFAATGGLRVTSHGVRASLE
jgi:hypothetical protein